MTNQEASNASKERAVERIKKLLQWVENARLTTADRPEAAAKGEAEVEAFARMARKLMDEHNINENEVLIADESARQTAYDQVAMEDALAMSRLVEMHDKRTAQVAADICDCKVFLRTDKWPKLRETVVFYGLSVDLAMCKAFFAELRASIKAMASLRFGSRWGTTHREYAAGFVSTLLRRVSEMKNPAATCTAIVLCKGAILDRWAAEKLRLQYVKTRSTKDFSRSSAFHQGRSDGQAFDLGVDRRLSNGGKN